LDSFRNVRSAAALLGSAEAPKTAKNFEPSLVRKSYCRERIRANPAMTVTGRSSTRIGPADSGIRPIADAGNWHALYTRHQHEKAIARTLSNKGLTVFLPLYGTIRLWRKRPQKLQLPLFPCYVFVQGGLDHQLQILSTPGIHNIVKLGGRPAIVSPEQIAAVRRIVENPTQVAPCEFLHAGDRVAVTSGSLLGVEGILVRVKGMDRLVVSMEMLGRSASVEIDVSCVRRIGQPLMASGAGSLSATA
jgi:transcription antitermination factor NusG